jgi:hypothetical protein
LRRRKNPLTLIIFVMFNLEENIHAVNFGFRVETRSEVMKVMKETVSEWFGRVYFSASLLQHEELSGDSFHRPSCLHRAHSATFSCLFASPPLVSTA